MDISLFTVVEVALGLALIYYVLSLIISTITGEILRITEMRSQDLMVGLREMLEDSGKLDTFISHPMIQNLNPKRVNPLPSKVSTKNINSIPSSTFALAVFDTIAPNTTPDESRDMVPVVIEALKLLPEESKTRHALLTIMNSGVKNMDEARQKTATWFDDKMIQISDLYTQHAKRIALLVAFVVTFALGTDSIQLTTYFWNEPVARAIAISEVDAVLNEEGYIENQSITQNITNLQELNIPIVWGMRSLPQTAKGWVVKIFGLVLTWFALAQGASFWYRVLKQLAPSKSNSSNLSSSG